MQNTTAVAAAHRTAACGAATWLCASTPMPTSPPSPMDSAWTGPPSKTSVMVGFFLCLRFVLGGGMGGGGGESGPSSRMSVMVIVGFVWVSMGEYDGEG